VPPRKRRASPPAHTGAIAALAAFFVYTGLMRADDTRGSAQPAAYFAAAVSTRGMFPPAWGPPPGTQTRDYRPLPAGYGHGSTTLHTWIDQRMKADMREGTVNYPSAWGSAPQVTTTDTQIVLLPLGYGQGSSTLKAWITRMAKEHGRYTDAELSAPQP